MRRIVHLSDLHFLPRSMARFDAIRRAVIEAAPSLVVVTGDLTRSGRRREFRAARAFTDSLPDPVFVVPGNHDVPVFDPAARLLRPLARFERFFPGDPVVVGDDAVLARLDTARGVTRSWDWSLGTIGERALGRLGRHFARAPDQAIRMVACHHPLIPDPADPQRSRTRGGAAALDYLIRLKVSILFHGHLHRTGVRLLRGAQGSLISIGAGTLSERERGAGASFNLVTLDGGTARVTEMLWDGRRFAAAQTMSRAISRELSGQPHD